jgi:hypothetical protein
VDSLQILRRGNYNRAYFDNISRLKQLRSKHTPTLTFHEGHIQTGDMATHKPLIKLVAADTPLRVNPNVVI